MIDTDKYEEQLGRWDIMHSDLLVLATELLAEVKRLRGLLDTIVDITLKELKIFDDNCPMINIRDLAYKGILWEE